MDCADGVGRPTVTPPSREPDPDAGPQTLAPTGGAGTGGCVYFSICSANYLPYARTLYASLRESGVAADFILFLVDEVAGRFDPALLPFACIETRTIGVPNHFDMAARYTVMEMNTAVKPFCVAWLFAARDAEAAVYLDPDVMLLRPLHHVHALIEGGHDLVLTPHSTHPLDDGGDPDDVRLLRTGIYNLGFAAFRRSPEMLDFLGWWGRQLESKCVVDLDRGLFVDQKFMDLAPAYLSRCAILRHPGYNVAYWNLLHRPVVQDAETGRWSAAGEDLHFFHFSGVDPKDRTVLSKHQDRFDAATIGDLAELLGRYLDSLDAHATLGSVALARIPYMYGHLSNGLAMTDDMKLTYAAARRPGPARYEDCFSPDLNLYATLAPGVVQDEEAPITRLAHTVWRRRSDVRRAYPLESLESRKGFIEWFATSGVREHAVPAPIAASFRTLREGVGAPGGAASPALRPGLGIYGYFRSESGLGTAVRSNWRAAAAAGIPCHAYLLKAGAFRNELDSEIPMVEGASPFDCLLLHVNADETVRIDTMIEPARLRSRYRIGYWAWELSEFPYAWKPAFDKVDEVWAPSRFVAEAIARRTTKPVTVVPHPVSIPEVIPADRHACLAGLGLPTDRFVFLTAFDLNSYVSRKNPLAAIRAFREAFARPGPSSPILVVKCHGRQGRSEGLADLRAAIADDPRIVILEAVLGTADILSLQAACDAFVSLHRSEGFGLWLAECMALGKPVICTDYSGNTDFAVAGAAIPIGFEMVPLAAGDYPFGEGQWWAEPDHAQAVEALRSVVDDDALRARIGAAARRRVGEVLSHAAVGRRMRDRLDAIRGEKD